MNSINLQRTLQNRCFAQSLHFREFIQRTPWKKSSFIANKLRFLSESHSDKALLFYCGISRILLDNFLQIINIAPRNPLPCKMLLNVLTAIVCQLSHIIK